MLSIIQRFSTNRLLFCLKGTMIEAELRILRARLDDRIRNKAVHGELYQKLG